MDEIYDEELALLTPEQLIELWNAYEYNHAIRQAMRSRKPQIFDGGKELRTPFTYSPLDKT